MTKIFRLDFHRKVRICAGCGERIPADKPAFWVYFSRCYGYAMFRKAVESFRKVRP